VRIFRASPFALKSTLSIRKANVTEAGWQILTATLVGSFNRLPHDRPEGRLQNVTLPAEVCRKEGRGQIKIHGLGHGLPAAGKEFQDRKVRVVGIANGIG